MRAQIIRILVVAAMCLGTIQSFAQGIVTGSIIGAVQDSSGAVVSGAAVTAVESATNSAFQTVTNNEGSFQIPGLPVGIYNLTIQSQGFSPLKIQNINVQTGSPSAIGIQTLDAGECLHEIIGEIVAVASTVGENGGHGIASTLRRAERIFVRVDENGIRRN